MEKKRSALRFGATLRFRDRWHGRLSACEVDADWVVQNLLLSRGLLWRRTVRVPFSAVSDWAGDIVAFDCTADEAFGRALAPAGVATRRLAADTPLAGAAAKPAGLLVDLSSRRASHLLVKRAGVTPEVRLVPVDQVSLDADRVALNVQAETLPLYRPEGELEQAVRQAIAAHPYLGEDDRRGLKVEAVDGVVYLRGNVRTVAARNWAQACAAQVRGVQEVKNGLVDDISLETAVGQALAAAGLFQKGRVFVRSIKGEIVLTGFVPSQDLIGEAEAAAAAVAGVRAVTARLEVSGPPPAEKSATS